MAKNSCQKKPNSLKILGTKVVQFWCYIKLIKNKKVAPILIFLSKFCFRKIFNNENQLWKSDFGTFYKKKTTLKGLGDQFSDFCDYIQLRILFCFYTYSTRFQILMWKFKFLRECFLNWVNITTFLSAMSLRCTSKD